jgi:hypothetical protein
MRKSENLLRDELLDTSAFSTSPRSRAMRPTLLRLRSCIASRNSSPGFFRHVKTNPWTGVRKWRHLAAPIVGKAGRAVMSPWHRGNRPESL